MKNLERPPFHSWEIEQMERAEARQQHLRNCEDLVTEARDLFEWIWNRGYGREVWPHNLDQTVSEEFERIAQFLVDTQPPKPKEDNNSN